MLGHWVRRLAEGGLVAALTATSPRRLGHPDGGPKLTGTNPLAIAIPSSDGKPVVVDVSMGNLTYGDVLAGRATEDELAPVRRRAGAQGLRARRRAPAARRRADAGRRLRRRAPRRPPRERPGAGLPGPRRRRAPPGRPLLALFRGEFAVRALRFEKRGQVPPETTARRRRIDSGAQQAERRGRTLLPEGGETGLGSATRGMTEDDPRATRRLLVSCSRSDAKARPGSPARGGSGRSPDPSAPARPTSASPRTACCRCVERLERPPGARLGAREVVEDRRVPRLLARGRLP